MAQKTRRASSTALTPAIRSDSWANTATNLNVAGKDKRRANAHATAMVDEETAEDLWRGDDICARAIETVPGMMLADGFRVGLGDADDKGEPPPGPEGVDATDTDGHGFRFDARASLAMLKPTQLRRLRTRRRLRQDAIDALEVQKELDAQLQDLGVASNFSEALRYARGFGGGGVLVNVEEDGRKANNPIGLDRELDLRRVKKVVSLIPLRRREMMPVSWYKDPLHPNYGTPRIYNVVRDTMGWSSSTILRVHESRIIRFLGTVTSRRQRAMNNSWGESILTRIVETVADFQGGYQGAAALLQDFAQGIWKIQGLAELIAAGSDDVISRRMANIEYGRSVLRSVLIDKEEDFVRTATPMSGYPETLDRLASRLSAATRIPVSLLMGEAPAGLNATGEANLEWFFTDVHQERERDLRPALNKLMRIIFAAKEGPTAGMEPKSWSVIFPPLRILTEKESAELRSKVAASDKLYVDAGVLTPEEVAQSRFGGDEWSPETRLDVETREAMSAAVDDAIEEGDAHMKLPSHLGAGPKPGMPPGMMEEGEEPGEDEDQAPPSKPVKPGAE